MSGSEPGLAALHEHDFKAVVRLAPLVSVDLVLRDQDRRILLGLRTNEPAKGCYFVPGGRIWKNERVGDAFRRILQSETGYCGRIENGRLLGVYDHIYDSNRFNDPDFGTHYVVLAYELAIADPSMLTRDDQHSQFVWWSEAEILASNEVHTHTKAYFSR